jgi:RNA polymerase sigma-70 factor, ECF subfamily
VNPKTDPADFMQIYSQYEARLRGYVQSLVPRWSDAEDIMQRCSLVLWKRFGQFEPGTNFFAWACQVVRFEVRKYHTSSARDKMVFCEAVMEAITSRTVECDDELLARIGFLQECVSKLPPDHRELLRLRYDEQRSVGSVAELLSRPIENVYKTLSRIRLALHLCISRRISAGQP